MDTCRVHQYRNTTMPGVDLSVAAAFTQFPKEQSHLGVQSLQVLPHHAAKKQSILVSEKGIAEVDLEVAAMIDPAEPKRRSGEDQAATSRQEDRAIVDHEVDLGTRI